MEETEPRSLEGLIADAAEIAAELALLEADAGVLLERANRLALQLSLLRPENN
jgi:hypothetical protein